MDNKYLLQKYNEREYGIFDTEKNKFIQKGPLKVMQATLQDLNNPNKKSSEEQLKDIVNKEEVSTESYNNVEHKLTESGTDTAVEAIKHYFKNNKDELDTDYLLNDVELYMKNDRNCYEAMLNTRQSLYAAPYLALIYAINSNSNTKLTPQQIKAGFKKLGLDFKEIIKPLQDVVKEEREENKEDKKEVKTESKLTEYNYKLEPKALESDKEDFESDMQTLSKFLDNTDDVTTKEAKQIYMDLSDLMNEMWNQYREDSGDYKVEESKKDVFTQKDAKDFAPIINRTLLSIKSNGDLRTPKSITLSNDGVLTSNNSVIQYDIDVTIDGKCDLVGFGEAIQKELNDKLKSDGRVNTVRCTPKKENGEDKLELLIVGNELVESKKIEEGKKVELTYINQDIDPNGNVYYKDNEGKLYCYVYNDGLYTCNDDKQPETKVDGKDYMVSKMEERFLGPSDKVIAKSIEKGLCGPEAYENPLTEDTKSNNVIWTTEISETDEDIEGLDYEFLADEFNNYVLPNIKKQCRNDVLVLAGSVGSWDGTYNGGIVIDVDNLLTFDNGDYDVELVEDSGKLIWVMKHHDGTHYMQLFTVPDDEESRIKIVKDLGIVDWLKDIYEYENDEDVIEDALSRLESPNDLKDALAVEDYAKVPEYFKPLSASGFKTTEGKQLNEDVDEKVNNVIEDEEELDGEKTLFDYLQDRIGQKLNVAELNSILQSLFGKYNEVFITYDDIINTQNWYSEPQKLFIYDDGDEYTITYNIVDLEAGEVEITDVELD